MLLLLVALAAAPDWSVGVETKGWDGHKSSERLSVVQSTGIWEKATGRRPLDPVLRDLIAAQLSKLPKKSATYSLGAFVDYSLSISVTIERGETRLRFDLVQDDLRGPPAPKEPKELAELRRLVDAAVKR